MTTMKKKEGERRRETRKTRRAARRSEKVPTTKKMVTTTRQSSTCRDNSSSQQAAAVGLRPGRGIPITANSATPRYAGSAPWVLKSGLGSIATTTTFATPPDSSSPYPVGSWS